MQILALLIVLQLLRRHQRLREAPDVLDAVVSGADGFGRQVGVTECKQARLRESPRPPTSHICLFVGENCGMMAMSGSPFSHSCTPARTWSRVIDGLMTCAEVRSAGAEQPRRPEAPATGNPSSTPRPTAGRPPSAIALVTPKLRIQLAEERLIVDVRIEQTRNDEFARQVHAGRRRPESASCFRRRP